MILKALMLGLSAGAFCMGTCAPVLMGLLLSRAEKGWRGNAVSLGLFLLGRFLAYILFAVISFGIGEIFRGSMIFSTLLLPSGEILLGLLMLIYSIHTHFPHLSFCGTALKWPQSRWTLFAAGVFTGMNLCPPFLMAVGMAADSVSVWDSILFFTVFFMTTTLYLLPFVFSGIAARFAPVRSAARIVCGLTGFWLIRIGMEKLTA
ncbi:MAG: sulfite exporter TauE/SafE family protein [Desulfococcaceae bacterium]